MCLHKESGMDLLWQKMLNQVHLTGERLDSRDGGSMECLAACVHLSNIRRSFVFNTARRLSPIYAAAEVLWYLSGSDDDRMCAYAPQFKRFCNEEPGYPEELYVHGAYGARMAGASADFRQATQRDHIGHTTDHVELCERLKDKTCHTPLAAVIQLLRDKPNTRQAVLPMWCHDDILYAVAGNKNDLPCTLNIQFHLRGGKLHAMTTMRSNDLWLGTPYDIFAFTCLQRLIADAVGVEYGGYTHFAGSLHYYDRNVGKVPDCLVSGVIPPGELALEFVPLAKPSAVIKACVEVEESIRKNRALSEPKVAKTWDGLLKTHKGTLPVQMLVTAACQFIPIAADHITNENIRNRVMLLLAERGAKRAERTESK